MGWELKGRDTLPRVQKRRDCQGPQQTQKKPAQSLEIRLAGDFLDQS